MADAGRKASKGPLPYLETGLTFALSCGCAVGVVTGLSLNSRSRKRFSYGVIGGSVLAVPIGMVLLFALLPGE